VRGFGRSRSRMVPVQGNSRNPCRTVDTVFKVTSRDLQTEVLAYPEADPTGQRSEHPSQIQNHHWSQKNSGRERGPCDLISIHEQPQI
jgi:hypothetical protein